MKYLLFFSIIACIYNLVFNFTEIISIRYITSGYELNLKSFFVNRNQFGSFLFISIVAHYYLLSGKKVQVLNIFIFALQITNLTLTMSRGAILASAIFFIILYLQHLKNIRVITSIIILISLMIFVILLSNKIMDFISDNILRLDAGVTGRSEIWEMGLTVLAQNNIINGVGYFTGVELAKAQGFQFQEFHSLYIDTLVNGGIIELAFLMTLLIYIFKRCIKKCYDREYKKIYIASFFGIFVLILW